MIMNVKWLLKLKRNLLRAFADLSRVSFALKDILTTWLNLTFASAVEIIKDLKSIYHLLIILCRKFLPLCKREKDKTEVDKIFTRVVFALLLIVFTYSLLYVEM